MTALSLPLTRLRRHWQHINTLSLLQPLCNQFQSKTSGQSHSTRGEELPARGAYKEARCARRRPYFYSVCLFLSILVLIAQKDVNTNIPQSHTKVPTSLGSAPSCIIPCKDLLSAGNFCNVDTLLELLSFEKIYNQSREFHLRDSDASRRMAADGSRRQIREDGWHRGWSKHGRLDWHVSHAFVFLVCFQTECASVLEWGRVQRLGSEPCWRILGCLLSSASKKRVPKKNKSQAMVG